MSDVGFTFRGDPTDARRAAQAVDRALEELSRQALKTAATMKAALSTLDVPLRETAGKIDGASEALDRHDTSVRRTRRSLLSLEGGLSRMNRGFAAFRNIISLLKWPVIVAGIGLVAQAISALTAGVLALTGALTPLVGLIGALPAGLALLITSVAATTLAFADLKQALDGNAEAIKRLTPEGRRFAAFLNGLKPLLRDIRREAQRGLFPGLEEGIRQALTVANVGTLRTLVRGTTQALGRGVAGIGEALGARGGDIRLVTQQQLAILNRFAALTPGLTRAFLDLAVAAAPLTDHLAEIVERFAQWISRSSEAGRASGSLNRFFQQTNEILDRLISLTLGFGGALKNVMSAGGAALGRRLLADLDALGKRLDRITRSVEGRNKIEQYFRDAEQPIVEMSRLLAALGASLLRLGAQPGVSEILRLIRTDLLPAFEEMIASSNRAFGPALIRTLSSLLRLLGRFIGPTGPLTVFVEAIGKIADGLSAVIDKYPGVSSVLVKLVAIAGIAKTISFAAAITGVRRFATLAAGTAATVGRANAAMRSQFAATGTTATVASGRVASIGRASQVAAGRTATSQRAIRTQYVLTGRQAQVTGAAIGTGISAGAVAGAAGTVVALTRVGRAVRTFGLLLRGALVGTGWGLLLLVISEFAYQLIFHFDRTKRYLIGWGQWFQKWAYTKALEFLEPFSHLPWKFGEWARKAKVAVLSEMQALEIQMAIRGETAGNAWGESFYNNSIPWLQAMSAFARQTTTLMPGATATPTRGGQYVAPKGSRTISPIPRGRAGGIIGTPGAGTHAAADWQSGQAYDIAAKAGTDVLAVEDGRIVKTGGTDPSRGAVRSGSKILYGYTVTLQGASGTTYFYAHLDNLTVTDGQRVRQGQVLGVVAAWKGGTPHVHFASTQRGGPGWVTTARTARSAKGRKPAQKQPPTPSFDTEPGGAYPITAVPPTADKADSEQKKQERVSEREREALLRQWRRLQRLLREIIPSAVRARLTRQLRAIGEAIRGAVRPQDLQRAADQLDRFQQRLRAALDVSKAIRELRRQLATLRAQIARLPEAMRGPLLKMANEISRILSQKTVTVADIEKVRSRLDRLKDAIQEKLDAIRELFDSFQEGFQGTWQRVADLALEAFDAATDELVKQARAPFEALTPAEKALDELQRRRRQLQREGEMAEAQSELAFALRTGDPDLIRRAMERVAEIEMDAEEERLTDLAAAERKHYDEMADLAEKEIRDRRRWEREALEGQLDEIRQGLAEGRYTYDEAMTMIGDVLAAHGLQFETVGKLLGDAFANAFLGAISAAAQAAQWLLWAYEQLQRAQGQAVSYLPPGLLAMMKQVWPSAQKGALVRRPTVLVTHADEAVLPLTDRRALQPIIDALSSGRGGSHVVFNFPNYVGTRHELERSMLTALRAYDRRNGGIPIRVTR